jgi:hypothetical protein
MSKGRRSQDFLARLHRYSCAANDQREAQRIPDLRLLDF